jgi:hypothetical protein
MRIKLEAPPIHSGPRLDPPLLALLAAYITGTTEYLVGHPSGPSNPVNDWPRAHQALGSPSPLILTETAHITMYRYPGTWPPLLPPIHTTNRLTGYGLFPFGRQVKSDHISPACISNYACLLFLPAFQKVHPSSNDMATTHS